MEQFYKEEEQDEDAMERIERLENTIGILTHQLDNYKNNPIRAELITLLNNDLDVKHLIMDLYGIKDIMTTIENEVDDQVGGLKNEIMDEVDEKLDEQFDTYAFKSAVSNYIRSKF